MFCLKPGHRLRPSLCLISGLRPQRLINVLLISILLWPNISYSSVPPLGYDAKFHDPYFRQVWLVFQHERLRPYHQRLVNQDTDAFLDKVLRSASLYNLSPDLVLAIVHVESRFDRFAISRAGAIGLMQVMPFWRKEIGSQEDNLLDDNTNLMFGCAVLRHYLDKESGNLDRALARYNGSLGSSDYPRLVYQWWNSYSFY
ncbi:lytic transglycosylase domain-containing protein [Pokkaliibacter plantistimulans]|uniref:lytic transglycosylase domain-containing protein n=1 Tax=Pokkaliibacter plantistimulans TaxID=1635171 RepID=UPI000D750B16|nr:lytic transglycosylase domain-containing protein [Pokkaliibacter plantistimulans]